MAPQGHREVGISIVPPPPSLPGDVDEPVLAVDGSTWENVRTYLRGSPGMARSLASVARRSKAKASCARERMEFLHRGDDDPHPTGSSPEENADLHREVLQLRKELQALPTSDSWGQELRRSVPRNRSSLSKEADGKCVDGERCPPTEIMEKSAAIRPPDERIYQRTARPECARHSSVAYKPFVSPGSRFSSTEGRKAEDEQREQAYEACNAFNAEAWEACNGSQDPEVYPEGNEAFEDESTRPLLRSCRHHLGPSVTRPASGTPIKARLPAEERDTAPDPHKRPWRGDEADTEARAACQEVEQGSDVTLHVYDLATWTRASNLPIFHLGVQVYRLEYFFCSRGIQTCTPANNKGHSYKESVILGRTNLTVRQVRAVVQHLRQDWRKESYRLLGRNCQTFASAFTDELGLVDCVPLDYRRFSELEDLRSQAAALVDGAAALLPRMAQGPSLLLNCTVPKIGSAEICSRTPTSSDAKIQTPGPFTDGSGDTPPSGNCEDENLPATANFLPHAAGVAWDSERLRRRPETRGGG